MRMNMKSRRNYNTLCRMLERNEITHQCSDDKLLVRCSVTGKDLIQSFIFDIDPVKMLIALYSPIPLELTREGIGDMAIALCMINHRIADGSFCLDTDSCTVYFKMTASFYDSDINDTVYEYMLSSAADLIDEYYPKLQLLTEKQTYTIAAT